MFCFLENFLGTQKRIRINTSKQTICVRVNEVLLKTNFSTSWWNKDKVSTTNWKQQHFEHLIVIIA